jgi:hypothetical protein
MPKNKHDDKFQSLKEEVSSAVSPGEEFHDLESKEHKELKEEDAAFRVEEDGHFPESKEKNKKREVKQKEILEKPSWDNLDLLVPSVLLSPHQYEAKPQERGLSQLFLDAFRYNVSFNGESIPLDWVRKKPDLDVIRNVLEGDEEFIPKEKKDQQERIERVCQFLKDKLNRHGMMLTLQTFDQSELAPYQFMLQDWVDQKGLVYTAPQSIVEFKYSPKDNVFSVKVASNKIGLKNFDNIESPDFFDENVTIGTKLFIKPDGEIKREFYTSSKNPIVIQYLLAHYVGKLGTPTDNLKLFAPKSTYSLECDKFKKEIEDNPLLTHILLANIDNFEKIIDILIFTRVKLSTINSVLQLKVNKLIRDIETNQQALGEEKLSKLMLNSYALQSELMAMSSYSGLLKAYTEKPVDDFIDTIEDRLRKAEKKLDDYVNELNNLSAKRRTL